MRSFSSRVVQSAQLFVAVSMFVCVGITTVGAQSGRLSASARRIDDFNKQTDKAIQDGKTGDFNTRKLSAEEIRKAKAVRFEIEESLTELQAGCNDLVIKLQSKEPVTDQLVAESIGKINRHAERLRSNIKFPESKPETKAADLTATMIVVSHRRQLVDLCTHIIAFFDSPFFENPTVLDVEKANEAKKILDMIIVKSTGLKTVKN